MDDKTKKLLNSKLRQPVHISYISKYILKLTEKETKEILDKLIDEGVIEGEIIKLKQDVDLKEKERIMYSQERDRFVGELQKIRDAEATLRAHSIKTKEELVAIQINTESKKICDEENCCKDKPKCFSGPKSPDNFNCSNGFNS